MKPTLSVIIPTYNRAHDVNATLARTLEAARSAKVLGECQFVVSDNGSADDTWDRLSAFKGRELGVELILLRNEKNLGVVENAIRALEAAAGAFVMFLGDDDSVGAPYIREIFRLAHSDPRLGVIVPDRRAIFREEERDCPETEAPPKLQLARGVRARWRLVGSCNQMSGLVLRREGLAAEWRRQGSSNLYPWIVFAGWASSDHNAYNGRGAPVRIWEGARKYWGYGKDGTVGHIVGCAKLVAREDRVDRVVGELALAWRWRGFVEMYWDLGVRDGVDCIRSLIGNRELHFVTRGALGWLGAQGALRYAVRRGLLRQPKIHSREKLGVDNDIQMSSSETRS